MPGGLRPQSAPALHVHVHTHTRTHMCMKTGARGGNPVYCCTKVAHRLLQGRKQVGCAPTGAPVRCSTIWLQHVITCTPAHMPARSSGALAQRPSCSALPHGHMRRPPPLTPDAPPPKKPPPGPMPPAPPKAPMGGPSAAAAAGPGVRPPHAPFTEPPNKLRRLDGPQGSAQVQSRLIVDVVCVRMCACVFARAHACGHVIICFICTLEYLSMCIHNAHAEIHTHAHAHTYAYTRTSTSAHRGPSLLPTCPLVPSPATFLSAVHHNVAARPACTCPQSAHTLHRHPPAWPPVLLGRQHQRGH